MPKIYFKNLDESHESIEGDSILDTALNFGVPIQHSCGGFCACATCHVKVIEGKETLSKPEEDELERLEDADGRDQNSRLACQARINGDLVVEVMNLE